MRKIVIGVDAGFAGTDSWIFYEVPDDITDKALSELAWECAKDHAEMYGVYPREEYADTEDYDEDDESYSDNIEGWWKNMIQNYTMGTALPTTLVGSNINKE